MALGNFYLTNAGNELLAKAQTGTALNITRAQIGEGTWPAGTNYANITALVNPIKYLSIVSKKESSGQAKITVQFSNSSVGRAFRWTEFGLWAADPDHPDDRSRDILYGTAYAGDSPIPIEASLTEFLFNVLVKIGQATNVTVTIDSSLIYLTKEDLEATLDSMKGMPNGLAELDESGKVPTEQLPEMNYDPAGSAEKVQKSLTAHTSDKKNPHGVTAEQVEVSKNVADLMGIPEGSSVDDAFIATLLVSKQLAMVKVAVTVAGAPAIAGVEVTGLEGLDGGAVYTDTNGVAVGFAHAGEVSLSTPAYQDLPAAPAVTKELAAGDIVDVDLSITSAPQAGDKSITGTTSGIRFSPYVTGVDVCCVGGGGGGATSTGYIGGGGGGGGYVKNSSNLKPNTKTSYTAVVGAAGKGGTFGTPYLNGTNGGDSSFMEVVGEGGRAGTGQLGGAGNGAGGNGGTSEGGYNGTDGTDGSVRAFNEQNEILYSGGGGGAASSRTSYGGNGGSPYGGNGGTPVQASEVTGTKGQGYGGGGGGGWSTSSSGYGFGADGYQGLVRYRWRVA